MLPEIVKYIEFDRYMTDYCICATIIAKVLNHVPPTRNHRVHNVLWQQ